MTQNILKLIRPILFTTAVLCILGALSLGSFPTSILPDITFPRVVVIAKAGDLPAKNAEITVAKPLEQAVSTIPGVQAIRTKIMRGAIETSVDFGWGTNMITNEQLVNARINQIQGDLPPGTQFEVERMNPTVFPIAGLSLQSASLSQTELWSLATYTIAPALKRIPGVAKVEVQGGLIPEIAVDISPRQLEALHLSVPMVSQAIQNANPIRVVGRVDRRLKMYTVIIQGEPQDLANLRQVVVSNHNGNVVHLGDIANVHMSTEDQTSLVTANGAPSVLINVIRQPEANTITVVSAVNQALKQLKPTLPPDLKIKSFYDQSLLVKDAIGSVRDAVLIGALFSVVILLVFLADLRATLVTAAIVPSTVLITFLIMRLSGLTLNLMTLGALAVGVGLVIDDAIVVVECIFRHLASGDSRESAVINASKEISTPMISSTMTTVVVFLPLVLLQGVAGAFFGALAITLTIALMVSLMLALFVSPAMCGRFLRLRAHHSHEGGRIGKIIGGYRKVLDFGLRNRWFMPTFSILTLALTVFIGMRLETGFMPEIDEGSFILDYHTPVGASLAESNRMLNKVENILKHTPEVQSFSRRTGQELGFAITESNTGDFSVMLKGRPRKPIDAVIADVRNKIQDQVPGLDIDFSQVLQDLIGDLSGAPRPIQIKLFGQDIKTLQSQALVIADKLSKVPGVADVQNGVVVTNPELTTTIDPVAAGRLGLNATDVADQVNGLLLGQVATDYVKGDQQLAVRVRVPERDRDSKSLISNLPIISPNGTFVPLSAVGNVAMVSGATELRRESLRRVVIVDADLNGVGLGTVVKNIQAMLAKTPEPPGVTLELGGQYKSQKESFNSLIQVLGLALLLVYSVMLYQFKEWIQPTVILTVIPMSMFGVVMGLLVTGTSFNVSSFMGAIMLVGIVVKNGILLLDQIQVGEKEGRELEDAVVHAGTVRIQPILMTTLTAILGLLPLAFGIGAGAEMQKPLAIAVIGGLTFSTVFTLVVMPLLYMAIRRRQITAAERREAKLAV